MSRTWEPLTSVLTHIMVRAWRGKLFDLRSHFNFVGKVDRKSNLDLKIAVGFIRSTEPALSVEFSSFLSIGRCEKKERHDHIQLFLLQSSILQLKIALSLSVSRPVILHLYNTIHLTGFFTYAFPSLPFLSCHPPWDLVPTDQKTASADRGKRRGNSSTLLLPACGQWTCHFRA